VLLTAALWAGSRCLAVAANGIRTALGRALGVAVATALGQVLLVVLLSRRVLVHLWTARDGVRASHFAIDAHTGGGGAGAGGRADRQTDRQTERQEARQADGQPRAHTPLRPRSRSVPGTWPATLRSMQQRRRPAPASVCRCRSGTACGRGVRQGSVRFFPGKGHPIRWASHTVPPTLSVCVCVCVCVCVLCGCVGGM
jgi:hypothetical protein